MFLRSTTASHALDQFCRNVAFILTRWQVLNDRSTKWISRSRTSCGISADMQGILPCEILGLKLDVLVIVMLTLLLQQETIGFFSTDFACTSKTIPNHLIAPLVTNNTRVTY